MTNDPHHRYVRAGSRAPLPREEPTWDGSPAITAEEWEKGYPLVKGWDDGSVFFKIAEPDRTVKRKYDEYQRTKQPDLPETYNVTYVDVDVVERPHACAAALLYEKNYGFTQEDVTLMRSIAETEINEGLYPDRGWALYKVAAKIAALLPPPPA